MPTEQRQHQHSALRALIDPVSPDGFIQTYWLMQPLFSNRSENGYFSNIFGWDVLNSLLKLQQPMPPRFRLVHKGQEIAASQYLRPTSGWRKALLHVASVESLLRAGSTLIINGVDELHTPLREALEDMEKTFLFPIHANLYAAWDLDEAFPMHWDEQETFIVQVEGRKHWTIHRPTAVSPKRGMLPPPPTPTGSPDLELTLEAGQSLYLPKGWWHRVTPVAEPSLHLTITCEAPSGADFLKWVVGRLIATGSPRFPVPREYDEDFLRDLRSSLSEELSRPDVIRAFWEKSEDSLLPAAPFRFPRLSSEQEHFIP